VFLFLPVLLCISLSFLVVLLLIYYYLPRFLSDLKPENIMLTSEKDDADLKLVDFGLATRVKGCNLSMYCGTAYYMVRKMILFVLLLLSMLLFFKGP
jgi:hypothetical protein